VSRPQTILTGVLLLILAAPVPAIRLLSAWGANRPGLAWIANRTLAGVALPRQDVPLTMVSWLDGSFQRSVSAWANENFAGRELAIRCFNQVLWSLFGKSYMHSETVIAGRNGELYETYYLARASGLLPGRSDEELDRSAEKLEQLRARLGSYHVPMVVLFTPSKAVTIPENAPARYPVDLAPGFSDRNRLKTRLLAAGVPVVDGAELTRNLGTRLPRPPFTRTGTHWTELAASYTAEEVLRKFESLGIGPHAHLKLTGVDFTDVPRRPDDDLLQVLNLARPRHDHYAYGRFVPGPEAPARQGRVVLVGGSFLVEPTNAWDHAGIWREMDRFFYALRIFHYPGAQLIPLRLANFDWVQTFGCADAVVVEINDSLVGAPESMVIAKAALNGLPAGPPPVIPSFSDEEWYPAETDSRSHWHWSKGNAGLRLHWTEEGGMRLSAALLTSGKPGRIRVLASGGRVLWEGTVTPGRPTPVRLNFPRHTGDLDCLRIESDILPAEAGPRDHRSIAFGLWNLSFAETSDGT
jgi:hypothetical protein